MLRETCAVQELTFAILKKIIVQMYEISCKPYWRLNLELSV